MERITNRTKVMLKKKHAGTESDRKEFAKKAI